MIGENKQSIQNQWQQPTQMLSEEINFGNVPLVQKPTDSDALR